MRKLFCPFLAAAVMATVVLLGVDRASAAIRITISDGTTERWYYSESSDSAVANTSIGTFDVMVHTAGSNYPGTSSGGSLSNTLLLFDNDPFGIGTLPTLTATAEVIDSVSGLTTGFVTDASVWANVQAASLAVFTLPAGSNLQISSDIGSQISDQTKEGGTVQNTTTVNGMVVPSLEVAVDSHLDAIVDVDFDAPAGYTLSSQVVYAGGTPGIQGLVIFATSGVTNLVPEPASMVVWGLGAAGLAFACARRRKARASA